MVTALHRLMLSEILDLTLSLGQHHPMRRLAITARIRGTVRRNLADFSLSLKWLLQVKSFSCEEKIGKHNFKEHCVWYATSLILFCTLKEKFISDAPRGRENELKKKIQTLEDTVAEYERQKYNVMGTFRSDHQLFKKNFE